ncbi:hypothetical protein [Xanthomonas oryzae]|uniref:hypothetical protein n=1 Tax=Xanthomonas oryzae TaxID=347 RepID=UPI00030158EE
MEWRVRGDGQHDAPTTAGAGMDQAIQLRGEGFVLRRWRADDLEALLRHADVYARRRRRPSSPAVSDPVLDIVIDGKACDGSGASLGQGERCLSAEPGYWLGCAYWNQG